MTAKRLRIPLLPGIRLKLAESALTAGLDPETFVSGLLTNYVMTGGISLTPTEPAPRTSRLTVRGDDLPGDVERSTTTVSGFVGVTKKGRMWLAKLNGETIGSFTSPEYAAAMRYYTLKGFHVGRGQRLHMLGIDFQSAQALAARTKYAPIKEDVDGAEDFLATQTLMPPPIEAAKPPRLVIPEVDDTCDWCADQFGEAPAVTFNEGPYAGKRFHNECLTPATSQSVRKPRPLPAESTTCVGTQCERCAKPIHRGQTVIVIDGRGFHELCFRLNKAESTDSTPLSIQAAPSAAHVSTIDDDADEAPTPPPAAMPTEAVNVDPLDPTIGVDPATVARWRFGLTERCAVCFAVKGAGHRPRAELCAPCNADYDDWLRIEAVPRVPTDGIYRTNALGSIEPESFVDYVKRVRR